jgi:hypothetical protein
VVLARFFFVVCMEITSGKKKGRQEKWHGKQRLLGPPEKNSLNKRTREVKEKK